MYQYQVPSMVPAVLINLNSCIQDSRFKRVKSHSRPRVTCHRVFKKKKNTDLRVLFVILSFYVLFLFYFYLERLRERQRAERSTYMYVHVQVYKLHLTLHLSRLQLFYNTDTFPGSFFYF